MTMSTTQSDAAQFATIGKIIAVGDGFVVFAPRGTTYEMQLKTPGGQYAGPQKQPVEALVHVVARKVWTVPSGGGWVQPIAGTPRIVQGRVRQVRDNQLIVQAGANFVIELPTDDAAIDLANGLITVGQMVNVTALPGAWIEIVDRQPAASA